MQLPAIRIAKRMGWSVIVADRNSTVPGAGLADYFEKVDLKDKETMLAVAEKYKRTNRLGGVFTAGTDFSTTVAFVAENLGLPGIPYSVALKATDKALMRAVFKAAGVACPAFVRLSAADDPVAALENLSFPLVIKPVDNMGARGVCRIDSREELLPAFESAIRASRTGSAILEEFMDGPEFSMDAVVYKGEITICGVADRHIFFPPFFVEMGHTMPTESGTEVVEQLFTVFKQGVEALGITDGAAKGDIFLTATGAKIGEIAARLSGGYMSGWTYPYASGIEPTLAAMKIALGLPPGELTPIFHRYSAERAFISIPGRVQSLTGTEEVSSKEGVRDLFCRIKPGDTVVFPTNNVEKCGNIITSGESRNIAVMLAEKAVHTVKILLESGNTDTENFLFGKQQYAPPAFTFENRENIKAFESMPLYQGDWHTVAGLSFIPLPCPELEQSRDWHGCTLPETLESIRQMAGHLLAKYTEPGVFTLGKIFWYAVIRGGYQGGIYCLETLACSVSDREQFKSRVLSWAELL